MWFPVLIPPTARVRSSFLFTVITGLLADCAPSDPLVPQLMHIWVVSTFSAIINKAAVNSHIQVSMWTYVPNKHFATQTLS